jgi:hypothetical protein
MVGVNDLSKCTKVLYLCHMDGANVLEYVWSYEIIDNISGRISLF